MKKIAIAGIALLAMFVFIGGNCGGGPVLEAPKITRVELTATTVKLFWQPIADATTEDFKEYVVYASKDSTYYDMAGDNDSLADFEIGIATDTVTTVTLAAGDIWYVQVRSRNSNDEVGDYNLDKPYVPCSPRATGKAVQVYGDQVGFASQSFFTFATGAKADSSAVATADWYLDVYRKTGANFITCLTPTWVFRHRHTGKLTKIKEFTGGTSIDEQVEITDDGWKTPESTGVEIAAAKKFFAFKCVDTTFAKIYVDTVVIDTINTRNSYIKMDWAWQDNKGFRYLAPGK